ncbi:MAG: cobalt transporter CbiM [Verrucomicrobiota bacterium]|nr:cobalt transporter CbiM [Verrucomicrobiota bacterium]
MHISEGILSGPVLASGAVLATAGIGIGLRRMSVETTPKTAMLSATFFVASLIHVPFGPSNAHLILNGLAGILLGWTVFPALAVALFLQAVLFQFGGLTVLGVNTMTMALPGVVAHYLFRSIYSFGKKPKFVFVLGTVLGAATVCLSGILLTAALAWGGRPFLNVAAGIVAAHIPIMIADGLVTGAAATFILKIRPDLLGPSRLETAA